MVKAVSRGQALQIAARVATQVKWDELDGDRLQQEVLELSPEEFGNKVTSFLRRGNPWGEALPDLDWVKTYEWLGTAFDPNILPIASPAYWHIPVLSGLTPNKVVKIFRRLGVDMSLYVDDLDTSVPINDRDPKNGSYLISCKAIIEADEENKNLSANMLTNRGFRGLTLLERLLLELAYYLATTKHLDITNVTLCSGSRLSDGDVPGVSWSTNSCEVYVSWYDPDCRSDNLRARAVR